MKFKKRGKKKTFKNKLRKKVRISRGVSIMGKHARGKYTQSFPIYANQISGGASFYGFNASYLTSVLNMQILEQIYSDSAFEEMGKSFGYYRIHAFSLNLARQLPVNQTAILVSPPFSLGVIPYSYQAVNTNLSNTSGIAANNYDIANHLKYINEQETGWWSKLYRPGKDMIAGWSVTGFFPINAFTAKAWIPTATGNNAIGINSNTDLEVVIGYDIAPTFASTGSNQSIVMAQLDITYYVEFALQRPSTVLNT